MDGARAPLRNNAALRLSSQGGTSCKDYRVERRMGQLGGEGVDPDPRHFRKPPRGLECTRAKVVTLSILENEFRCLIYTLNK
jgi:hypothetical protein